MGFQLSCHISPDLHLHHMNWIIIYKRFPLHLLHLPPSLSPQVVDDASGSVVVDDPDRAVSSVLITFGIVDLAGCMGAGMKINDWALK